MGKLGGSSWLTAVKRAFRSPTKDSDKKSSRRKLEHRHEQDDEKKTERRRWLFKKHSSQQSEPEDVGLQPKTPVLPVEQRHAIAVAAATAAAAEAAVATAKAAIEIIRLTQPSNAASFKQHSAARVIQTAFRGYLSRQALVALKGIVKLQALIRGQNVRKQANVTMRCMQALLRVQARVRDQRARFSHDGARRSMFAETSNLWESKYLKDITDRKSRSTSRDSCSIADDWSRCPLTLSELEAIMKTRNESALAHEKNSLAFAFIQQNKMLDYDRMPCADGEEHEVQNRENCLDGWLAGKQSDSRASTELKRDSVKAVEIDSYRTTSNGRKSRCQSPVHRQSTGAGTSPHRRSVGRTPPPPRPSSPRPMKEEKCYSTANTPSLRSVQRLNCSSAAMVPNYMAATKSARARTRSQSAPRQRPSTPERERGSARGGGSARQRLSYPVPEPDCAKYGLNQNLRSPSFKSVQAGYVGVEDHSSYSCYTDSVGGEISPCSTTDLSRWLR